MDIRRTPDDAPAYQVHNVTFRPVVRSVTGATQLAAWQADFAPRTPGQPHRMSTEEILRVLAGELHIRIADDESTVEAGQSVFVPAGALFCVDNRTDAPASAWVVTPIGMTAQLEADGSRLTPPWAQ